MAIYLKQLEKKETEVYSNQYSTFTDVALDIEFNTKDMKVALDERAIKNSLITLFNTRPGENILVPQYGLALDRELFTQLTEINGRNLISRIRQGIATFEPRVTVNKVDVQLNIDGQEYLVDIQIEVPALKYKTNFTGIFDQMARYRVTS